MKKIIISRFKFIIFFLSTNIYFSAFALSYQKEFHKKECPDIYRTGYGNYNFTKTISLLGHCSLNPLRNFNKINIYGVHLSLYDYFVFEPNFSHFLACAGSGCSKSVILFLKDKEIRALEAIFEKEPKSSQEEREKIALSLAYFEYFVGKNKDVNTWGDRGKNGTFFSIGSSSSLGHDCIAESHNTLSYLLALQREGFLKFHKVKGLVHRFPPHNAVIIEEVADLVSHKPAFSYVVDTWFLNNAYPAVIVETDSWKNKTAPNKEDLDKAKNLAQKLPEEIINFIKQKNLFYKQER